IRHLEDDSRREEGDFLRLLLEEREEHLERIFRLMGVGGTFAVLLLAAAGWRIKADLAERRKLESELERFFSLSVDLLCIADFRGYFTRLSASWQAVLGWSVEELKTRPFIEFVHPEDREKTATEAARLAGGASTTGFENRYQCRDGSFRTLSWCAGADPK